MTNTQSFAKSEFDILHKICEMNSDPDEMPVVLEFESEMLAICEAFGKSGQSGGSAPYTAGAICSTLKKLLMHQPIAPVMGTDDEWVECTKGLWQNMRCSALFKNDKQCWYLDAIIWRGDTEGESGNTWDTFTGTVAGITSRQCVKSFPFTPKSFYIDLHSEMYDETNILHLEHKVDVVSCGPGDRIYFIKFPEQLEKVFEYYNRYENLKAHD